LTQNRIYKRKLSDEEVNAKFIELKVSSGRRTEDLRAELIEEFYYLVDLNALHYLSKKTEGYEDIFAAGVLGLIIGIDNFDLSRGIKFQSFVSIIIRRKCYWEFNRQLNGWLSGRINNKDKPPVTRIYLDELAHIDDETPDTPPTDLMQLTHYDLSNELEEQDYWDYMLSCLTEQEKACTNLLYAQDKTKIQIGEILGLSARQVEYSLFKSRNKIKELLSNKEK